MIEAATTSGAATRNGVRMRADDGLSHPPLVPFLVLFAVVLLPIAITATIPLDDYHNHIARMYILVHYDDVPALHAFVEPHWALLPNLAMEMFIVPLGHVMSVLAAGKLFIALSFVGLVAGVALTNRVLSGHWSLWPLSSFLLLYSDVFLFGFQSYMMSVAIALLLFALWVHMRESPIVARLLVFSLGATFLYFCHLTGFGIYAVLIGGYEVSRGWERRRGGRGIVGGDWLALIGQFALPVLLFVLFSPTAEAASRTTIKDLANKWHYFQKLSLLSDVFLNYRPSLDEATFALVVIAVLVGFATRRLRFIRHGFLPCAALGAVFAVMPKMMFSSDFADDRIAVALALVFVASTDWAPLGARMQRIAAVAIAALVVVRVGAIATTWKTYDRDYTAYLHALKAMPEGKVIGGVIAYEGTALNRRRPPLYHFLNLATITRHAFYPTLFAVRSQQPIALKPHYKALADEQRNFMSVRTGGPRGAEPLASHPFDYGRLKAFDYVFIIREHLLKVPRPDFLKLVSGGDDFGLYRVAHGG